MNGRDHIICNLATLGSLSILDACLVKSLSDDNNTVLLNVVNSVNNWLMDGSEIVSLYTILILAFFIFGSILPDVDSKSSLIGKWIYVPVEHRTWFHALYIPILLFIISIWVRPFFFLAFGYLLHLFFDSFSTCGICWFYPYPGYVTFEGGARVKDHHWIKLYKTNSTGEYVIVVIMVAIFMCCLFLGLTNDVIH